VVSKQGDFERPEFVLRLIRFSFAIVLVFASSVSLLADTPSAEIYQLFPERVGAFARSGIPGPPDSLVQESILTPQSQGFAGQVEYAGNGNRFRVEVVRFHQDAEAYSLLSQALSRLRETQSNSELNTNFGTSSYETEDQIAFFKGLHFVRLTRLKKDRDSSGLKQFAQVFSDSIDKGEAEIPALVKHLPDADRSQKTAVFLTRFSQLQQLAPNQQALSAIDSGGNADAVISSVGPSKVLIIEFNTPQLASDNDKRIIARIQELWKSGQLAPSAYRRVGNYSVFVFDAPDESTAKKLIDQVKYEQVVQWLGENPNILKEAERRYVNTTLGVFVAVVKASGMAFVACLGIGGLIGALLFSRRRAQQKHAEAFSDAGGMLRLNLDDLSAQTDPSRLLRDRN
jgi:hypothetical protein